MSNMEVLKGRHAIMPEVERKGSEARVPDDLAQDEAEEEMEVLHSHELSKSDSISVPMLDKKESQEGSVHGVEDALNIEGRRRRRKTALGRVCVRVQKESTQQT